MIELNGSVTLRSKKPNKSHPQGRVRFESDFPSLNYLAGQRVKYHLILEAIE